MICRYFFITILSFLAISAQAQFKLDLEGGVVFGTNYNKVRIPNTGGTLVNLPRELNINPKAFYRIRAGYAIAKRHNISVLYAPLTVRYDGSFRENINFNNLVYNAGQPLEVFYKFNSYRLTYRYDFISTGRWKAGAGLTGKIRDADIRFRNDSQDTHFDNLGFVPLVNFYVSYNPSYRWSLIAEGDALASKFGRAEDIFAGASYQINSKLAVKLGYRVVEGGADVDDIYNFNWINYASAGLILQL
jgi:opacity protein-like surface antigen